MLDLISANIDSLTTFFAAPLAVTFLLAPLAGMGWTDPKEH